MGFRRYRSAATECLACSLTLTPQPTAETSPVSFQTGLDSPVEKRVETVGRVVPHVDAKIIDPATGESVPLGTPGELLSRGYIVMDGGYWGEPEQTQKAIDADGFMHSGFRSVPSCGSIGERLLTLFVDFLAGDLAEMDAEGYVKIVGRIKDLIIVSSSNSSLALANAGRLLNSVSRFAKNSAEEKTSTPPTLKTPSTATRKSPTSPSSASPTSVSAKPSAPGSSRNLVSAQA